MKEVAVGQDQVQEPVLIETNALSLGNTIILLRTAQPASRKRTRTNTTNV